MPEIDYDLVQRAIGMKNAYQTLKEQEADLLLSYPDCSYGGKVGIVTSLHVTCCDATRGEDSPLTALNMGYYNARCPECWKRIVRRQLSGEELQNFEESLEDPSYGGDVEASGGLDCPCGNRNAVEFEEGCLTCEYCAGAVIAAAEDDEENVKAWIKSQTEHPAVQVARQGSFAAPMKSGSPFFFGPHEIGVGSNG